MPPTPHSPLPELEHFMDRVYWLVRQIPEGRVATYGQLAHLAGKTRAARAVGNILRRSTQNGARVPWQRVINARGGISFKGDLARAELQRHLLEQEGVDFGRTQRCDLETYGWTPARAFWEVEGD